MYRVVIVWKPSAELFPNHPSVFTVDTKNISEALSAYDLQKCESVNIYAVQE